MAHSLVFTLIGQDNPGLIEHIARVVNAHEANWLGSRMSQLGGKFAGMIHVEGDAAQLKALRLALTALSNIGLTIVVEDDLGEAVTNAVRKLTITILGLDRLGIVREVSAALARRNINVLDLHTEITQAAMTGGLMFNGTAILACPDELDQAELASCLDAISVELGVDIDLMEDD